MNIWINKRIYIGVRRFRNIWFALAAFFWLPAMAHCQLESLTGFELLTCADEATASHTPTKDCSECCAVEKSEFRAHHSRLTIPVPEPVANFLTVLLIPDLAEQARAPLDVTSAPPDLTQRWRFLSRTALPVRAPSLVS